MREPIYELKGVKLDELEREYGLQIWFYNMVQKIIRKDRHSALYILYIYNL